MIEADIIVADNVVDFRAKVKEAIQRLYTPKYESYRHTTSGRCESEGQIFSIMVEKEIPDPEEICATCREYFKVTAGDEVEHICLASDDDDGKMDDDVGYCELYVRARYE